MAEIKNDAWLDSSPDDKRDRRERTAKGKNPAPKQQNQSGNQHSIWSYKDND
jgi:hypothetical protein